MKTLSILIGNADNKLPQAAWSKFIVLTDRAIREIASCIHFYGGSGFDAPRQSVCWVVEVGDAQLVKLRETLKTQRIDFKQDSVAIVVGDTEFI